MRQYSVYLIMFVLLIAFSSFEGDTITHGTWGLDRIESDPMISPKSKIAKIKMIYPKLSAQQKKKLRKSLEEDVFIAKLEYHSIIEDERMYQKLSSKRRAKKIQEEIEEGEGFIRFMIEEEEDPAWDNRSNKVVF